MKKYSKLFWSFIAVLVLLVLAVVGGNMFIKSELENALKDNLNPSEFNYEKLNVNLLGRSTSLTKPTYKKEGLQISAEEIVLDGIDIFEYLSNKNIEISNLKIYKPEVAVFTETQKNKDSAKTNKTEDLEVLIKSVEIVDGDFKMAENDSLKPQIFARIPSLNLTALKIDQETLKNKIPFGYKNFEMISDSLFFNLKDLHHIYIDNVKLEEKELQVNKIKFRPLYNKQEFQQHIPYEKDRFDIMLQQIALKSFSWDFKKDSLYLKSENTRITNGDIKIFRDKQVKDDVRQKPMYSKMIRDLPFKLKLDTIRVEDLAIQYEELVKSKRGPGKVTFKDLNASIYNISNINMNSEDFPETAIDVQTQFQGEAALKVNWNFDISNKADFFEISGQMDRISSAGINQFMEPALNVKAEGGIRDMQFNFTGNNQNATGDMKLVYHDFKVEVLQEDGEEKNKLLSALANLIVNNDATSEEKEQKNIKTQRTQNKSFWNYLWKNVRNGALKSFL